MVSYVFYKEKLKDDYLKAFDYVETYSMSIQVPEQENEEMLNNLLDMLYEAQENGQPVEKIVGKDLQQFCTDYFQDYTPVQNFFVGLMPYSFRVAVVVFIFSILEIIGMEKNTPLFQATTDISGYLCGIIVGIITTLLVSAATRPLLLHWKKFTNKIYMAMTITIFVITLILSFTFWPEMHITVPLFTTLLLSGCYIILYQLVKWIIRYRKTGTVRKSPEESYSLKDTLKATWDNENLKDDVLEMLVKTYHKKNARLARRGRETITPQAHTEKVRKDIRLRKYDKAFFILLFIIIIVTSSLSTEFISIPDFIFSCLFMCVFEGLIIRFFYKCSQSGFDKKAALLAQCDAEGITLVELWERQNAKDE